MAATIALAGPIYIFTAAAIALSGHLNIFSMATIALQGNISSCHDRNNNTDKRY